MDNSTERTELIKKTLTPKEIKISGGGAQIEFFPFPAEDIGMRVYKDTKFPESDSSEARLRGEISSFQLRWALAESLLSLNLSEKFQATVPKLLAVGLFIPQGEGSFYFEIDRKKMQGEGIYEVLGFIYAEGCKFTKSRITKPKIFTLVETVPIAQWGETDPTKYYSPRCLAEDDPKAYKNGLVAGLKFYRECLRFGMWNFDITDKDPFLCDKKGKAKVIDTSGFRSLKVSQAEALMKGFYKQEITNYEETIIQEVKQARVSSLKSDDLAEYEQLSKEIDNLRQEGQILLTTLGVKDQIDRYEDVKSSLDSKERDIERGRTRKESLTKELDELRAENAEAERRKSLKVKAGEIDKKIQVAERRLREARDEQEKVSALRDLRTLATEVVNSGKETVDGETGDRLFKLELATRIKNNYGYREDLYCQGALAEIEVLDREKPLQQRLTFAQEQLENALEEVATLREQRTSLGEFPAFIFGPLDYKFEEAEKGLSKIKSDSEMMTDQKGIARIREILERITRYSSLNFRVRYAESESLQKAKSQIEFLRTICFEDELPKSTDGQVNLNDIVLLLGECGFEKFLDIQVKDELRKFYNLVKTGQYPIKDPQQVLDIFIRQIESLPAGQT